MSSKHRVATFSILVGLPVLAVTLSTTIAVKSVLAQNSTDQEQASSIGNNGGSSNNNTSSSNSTTSTGSGTKVSIVEEASEMGDQAYDPNPVKVKAENTVTWTNDDSQAHTITSVTDSSDPNIG